MEIGSVLQFLQSRTILVTGATGFLAKIFVEKILRVQPNVKKLYLLVRASDDKSALQRFNTEIIGKELFRPLKEECGEGKFKSLISEKISLVCGDITYEDLGVKDSHLVEEMKREVDVVVNVAASTNFDERYDLALYLNALGAKYVLNFAKACPKLKVFLHVSTAYVSGEKAGLILESSYKLGEALNGAEGLDIEMEKKLVDEKLKELRAQHASPETITSTMKDFGIQRARIYGWPNTYVFTKAMGEMLLGHLKEHVPVVIIRPTIITSTFKEPFPGWMEGVRTIDSLAVGYGKGKLKVFLGDTSAITDVIPADMVVNAMIVAMAAHREEPLEESVIYQVGSSVSNPIPFTNLQDFGFRYFSMHPWIGEDGNPVIVGKVTVFKNMASFNRYMAIHYLIPLTILQIINAAFCQYFRETYLTLYRKVKFVLRLIDLYAPYLFFRGIYDDMNTERLRRAARESGAETEIFYFDPRSIDWEDYFMKTHIPGVVKHVFK